jgi:hypothetical protein
MNFGKWIVVAYVLFAIFIGTLVTVCVKQDVNLVSKSYYKDELAYQDQIKRINNTTALKGKPVIEKIGNTIKITLGNEFDIQKGHVTFFCPSNPAMDKDFELAIGDDHSQTFDVDSFQSSMYKAKLSWTMNEKEYYYEEIIYI